MNSLLKRDSQKPDLKLCDRRFAFFLVAEYLKAESKNELRHEYLAGQIFAMSATGYA
ncbi:hypothetical protein ACWATR_14510 [Nostoc sp. UIC 10890]